jgi:lipoate-protein ligase A
MDTVVRTSQVGAHNASTREAIVPPVADHTAGTIARLRQMVDRGEHGALEWCHPRPHAAFSRRDAHRPGFAASVDIARAHGFEPFIRPVGGRLAMYHEGTVVLDLYSRSSDPRPGTNRRFEVMSGALARGLRRLGVDAHVGEVPGEYCPGRWSVNAAHRTKIIGTGQRLTREAALFTAVIVVGHAESLSTAMAEAYRALDYDFTPDTVGSIAQHVPDVTIDDVITVLGETLSEELPLDGVDVVGGRRLVDPWDPR